MAAEAAPLPIPSQVDNTSPVATLLATLSNALPGMSAEVANAIARVPGTTPDTALINGQATHNFEVTSQQVQGLRAQSTANQQAVWQTAAQTPGQQQALTAAGYKPPHSGGSIFGDVTHALGTTVHDVLNAAGAPLRAEQHVERTLLAPPRSGAEAGLWGNLFSPQNWADAWEQTSNGRQYIVPRVSRYVQQTYGPQVYNLANQLARGTDPNLLMQAADQQGGPTAAAQLAKQIKSPDVQKAYQTLMAGHLSVGRMVAGNLGLPMGGHSWNIASGLVDGTLDWFGDPTVIGAKAGAVARASTYLVRDSVDVENAYRGGKLGGLLGAHGVQVTNSFQKALQFIAEHSDNPSEIMQRWPKLPEPIIQQITTRHPTSELDVLNIFKDNANIKAMMTYHPGSLPGAAGGGWLPTLSTSGQLKMAAKGALTKAVDWAADGPAGIDEHLNPTDVVSHALTGVTQRLQVGAAGAGALVKRVTRLAPPEKFDAYGPRAAHILGDIASMGVTGAKEREYVNQFIQEANLGGKRVVYTNLMKDVFARLGIGDTPYGQQWLRNFATPDSDENPVWAAKYATGNNDLADLGRGLEPVGIAERHLQTEWPVPDFKVLYAQAKKLGMTHAVMGVPNYRLFDGFMQQIWKPLALARIGFALRVAGEELFGGMLRNSPSALIRARLAASSLKADTNIEPGNILLDPLHNLYQKVTNSLPSGTVKTLATQADAVSSSLGESTARGMRNVAGKLATQKYVNAARIGFENGHFEDSYNEYISAHHGAGYLEGDIGAPRIQIMMHGQLTNAGWRKTGSFAEVDHSAGDVFAPMWWDSLNEMATSQWYRKALETMDLPYGDRLNAVADEIERNPKMASRSPLWNQTTDGRKVDEGDATRREATVDWARRLVDEVDHNVRTPVLAPAGGIPQFGAHIPVTGGKNLRDYLLDNRKSPSIAALEQVPSELKPLSVRGPSMVPVIEPNTIFAKAGDLWTKGIDKSFNVITRQINWISRSPLYLHNFASSLEAYGVNLRTMEVDSGIAASWKRMGMSDEEAKRLATEGAIDRAVSQTTPYIHNPQLRSQFSNITRNLMPFWFAQEQFYKRWARTMAYSPWAFRQAQLISGGVQHSGFVHTDPTTGAKYFVYPGSAVVQDVLTRSLSAIGYKSYLPIGAALRGQVNQASPGLERLGLPSYGPLVVVPVNLVRGLFPELRQPLADVEGPQAANTSFTESLVPTTLTRIWQDITSSPTNSQQYASAMMQAIQYLEATGHGIGAVATTNLGQIKGTGTPPADPHGHAGDYVTNAAGVQYVLQGDGTWRSNAPEALQTWLTRVKNWTRIFLVTRTIFGFTGPATPTGLFDPNHVNEDLQGLLNKLPLEDALSTFMTEHPDASAYTVFQTATQAGDPLPATGAAMDFLNSNSAFMKDHPLAGAYFIPAVDSSGKFDLNAYETQMAEQLRLHKDPGEFWQEIAYAPAATEYFNAEDKKNAALNQGGDYQSIDQQWTQESQQFLAANPLFAQQLGVTPSTPGSLIGGQSTTYSRANLLSDLVKALNDPRAPQTQQTADMTTLVNSYITLEAMVSPYGQPGSTTMSSDQRYQIETQYAQQVTAFVQAHPDIQALYNRLIRPTLSSVLSTEAQAL